MAESKREKLKKKIKENPVKAGLGAGALLGAGAGYVANKTDHIGGRPLDMGKRIFRGGPGIENTKILDNVIEGRAIERLKKSPHKSALKGALGGAALGGLVGKRQKTKEAGLLDKLKEKRLRRQTKDMPTVAKVTDKNDNIIDRFNYLPPEVADDYDLNKGEVPIGEDTFGDIYTTNPGSLRMPVMKKDSLEGDDKKMAPSLRKFKKKLTKESALKDGLEKVAYASGLDKEVIAEIVKEASSTAPELKGLIAEHNQSEENADLSKFVEQIDGLTKEEARKILEQVRG